MNWNLQGNDGNYYSISDFKGKKLVLFFYPKDSTKGCTQEAIEFTELLEEFNKFNTEVVGVSRNKIRSHNNFIEKYDLGMLLLSDPDAEVHSDYGIMVPKKMFGKEYIGVERSTFIYDEEGKLIKEFRNIKPSGHAADVLEYIKKVNL